MKKATNVDSYIKGFPKETQEILKKLRATIKKTAPEAEEVLSYGMPAYKYYGVLVYFAGHTHHVGLYPYPGALKNEKFKKELVKYKTSKSTIQFPIGKPLPISLIAKIIKFRVKENLVKQKMRKTKSSH